MGRAYCKSGYQKLNFPDRIRMLPRRTIRDSVRARGIPERGEGLNPARPSDSDVREGTPAHRFPVVSTRFECAWPSHRRGCRGPWPPGDLFGLLPGELRWCIWFGRWRAGLRGFVRWPRPSGKGASWPERGQSRPECGARNGEPWAVSFIGESRRDLECRAAKWKPDFRPMRYSKYTDCRSNYPP